MEVVVQDNFLDRNSAKFLKDLMLGNSFPWYLNYTLEESDDVSSLELTHFFHKDHAITSNFIDAIYPILNIIDPIALVRIRAALVPRLESRVESGWHTDFFFNCTTGIYYVNSNDGFTKFRDGTIVESVENRFVYFPSQLEHTGTYCTDKDFRCLINFNYIDRKNEI